MTGEDDDILAIVDAAMGGHAPVALSRQPRPEVIADNLARAHRRPTPALGIPTPRDGVPQIIAEAGIPELSAALITELARNEPAPKLPPDPRDVPVRFSSLKHMSDSPLHYKDQVQFGRDDTLCMRIGRGAHALVLGQPIIEFTGKTRQGKAWEAFREKHADKEILNAKEYSTAMGIYTAITSHREACEILFGDDAVLEETLHWEFLGKACTSRPDSRRGTRVASDLKTTKKAEPEWFKRDAYNRGYHGQMSFYGAAMQHALGHAPDNVFCVAVESKRPFPVTVLELTPRLLAEGEKSWRLWFERVLQCEAANRWPAYTEAIEVFDVPEGGGDVRLLIGGEEFSYDQDDLP